MNLEEQIRQILKQKGNDEINITLPAAYLERMVNWYDFCEGEGFSNDIDNEILDYLKNKLDVENKI